MLQTAAVGDNVVVVLQVGQAVVVVAVAAVVEVDIVLAQSSGLYIAV